MTRQETLDILDKLNKKLESMTDEELYEHMMKTSPSFRHTIEEVDKWVEAQELKEDEIFDEYGNYKYSWGLKYTPTDVSATGGTPLSEQLMDLGIVDGDTVKPTPKMDDLKSNFNNPFQPEGHWISDNKTEVTNPDAVDNKTDSPGPRGKEKITPIEIKIEHSSSFDDEEEEEDKPQVEEKLFMCLEKEEIISLKKVLMDYKYLLYDEIQKLSTYRRDVDTISMRVKQLEEVNKVINSIKDFMAVYREKTGQIGTVTLDGIDPKAFAYSKEVKSWVDPDKLRQIDPETIKNITNELGKNTWKDPETMFANPELVKRYQDYMTRNVFTNTDGDKDDN